MTARYSGRGTIECARRSAPILVQDATRLTPIDAFRCKALNLFDAHAVAVRALSDKGACVDAGDSPVCRPAGRTLFLTAACTVRAKEAVYTFVMSGEGAAQAALVAADECDVS
eukprot:IDg10432t1